MSIVLLMSPTAFCGFEVPGGDSTRVKGTEAKLTVCRMTKDWEIIDGPNPLGNAGGDGISVYSARNLKKMCELSERPALLKTIGYFMALKENLLILDTGTGPDVRQIHIYDLVKSTQVYQASYTDHDKTRIDNGHLIYWTNRDTLTRAMGCQAANGNPVGVNVEMSIDLKTLEDIRHFEVGGVPDGMAWAVQP